MAAAAVYHTIVMRVAFFPSRCMPCHHWRLRAAAEHADQFLSCLYGDAYQQKLDMYLQLHWLDIIKHEGESGRFIQNVFPRPSQFEAPAAAAYQRV